VVTSEPTRGQSYHEICEFWSFDDLDHANCVIDAYELAQLKQRATAAAEAERAKR
jgi:hypothetical protein